MNNFKTEIIGNPKTFEDSRQTNIKLTKNNKKDITLKEIQQLAKKLMKDAPKGSKLAIKALGVHGMRSFKTYDSDTNFKNEEEYLDGRVKETTKFTNEFSQIYFSFLKPI
jgi:hypothetical protein